MRLDDHTDYPYRDHYSASVSAVTEGMGKLLTCSSCYSCNVFIELFIFYSEYFTPQSWSSFPFSCCTDW